MRELVYVAERRRCTVAKSGGTVVGTAIAIGGDRGPAGQ